MKTYFGFTLTLCLMTPVSLGAQGKDYPTWMEPNASVGLATSIALNVYDQVDDNCWTNSDLIRSAAYLNFERNDIFVPDYEPAFINSGTPEGQIYALGFRNGSGVCAVYASFRVRYPTSDKLGGADGREEFYFSHNAVVYEKSVIVTNLNNVDQQLKDSFEGWVTDFIATGISERRNSDFQRWLQLYPPTGDRPMSQAEWDEAIAGFNGSGSE